MKKITLTDRLKYAFDSFMAKGTISLIGGLAFISAVFILTTALFLVITGIKSPDNPPLSLPEALWSTLMRTLDTGTVGGDTGWVFRLFMLFVTFGGIFIISTLIGLLTSGIEAKLDELRKGRSRVIEENHIVILGWSFQMATLLAELLTANANQPQRAIVILSNEDKVEMEETINKWLNFKYKTRIVCRTGNCADLGDLGLVNIQNSRSIIILNPPSETGDINLIKTLLAITNIPRDDQQRYHIVAEVQDEKSLDVIKLIAGNQVETLLKNDIISRISVQTCRESGLAAVYMDLFDFSGNEIYLVSEPSLVGKKYGNIIHSYPESSVIGISKNSGSIELNPPENRILQTEEKLIVLAEDDDTSHVSAITPNISENLIVSEFSRECQPENTLILGWNIRIPSMIKYLEDYVAPNSGVTVVANLPKDETLLENIYTQLSKQKVTYYQGDPTEKSVLESLNLTQYQQILITASDQVEPELADAQTLVTLLQLRYLIEKNKGNQAIITEMLDMQNQELAAVAKPDDFVISERIISLIMAQVAENKILNRIFQELLDSEGTEIYLKPVTNYVVTGQEVNFYTVVESGKRQGESVIGYRLKSDINNKAKNYGIILNPRKSDLITFKDQDQIIVISES